MIFCITVTDITTGRTKEFTGDLASVYNFLDLNSSFEFTVGEINRATVEGEILQINAHTTAQITRVL